MHAPPFVHFASFAAQEKPRWCGRFGLHGLIETISLGLSHLRGPSLVKLLSLIKKIDSKYRLSHEVGIYRENKLYQPAFAIVSIRP